MCVNEFHSYVEYYAQHRKRTDTRPYESTFLSYSRTFFVSVLSTMSHDYYPLCRMAVIHCVTWLLSTVSHDCYPLCHTTVIHCVTRLLSTVSHDYYPLYRTTVIHCVTRLISNVSHYYPLCHTTTIHCIARLYVLVYKICRIIWISSVSSLRMSFYCP